jgi:hypothetical protein
MIFDKHPRERYVYAVCGGKYLGEMFVFMEKQDTEYCFLSLPDMKIRQVPIEKFDMGLKEKILDTVNKLPKDVYDTCQKQYKINKTIDK